MAIKLPAEELLKIELGDFYAYADDTVREKALANIRKKYKTAGQAKAARTTRTTEKAARAACDSPPPKKRPGRPRSNPEGSTVWGLRVTGTEKFMIKVILDYIRKAQGYNFSFRVMDDDSIDELKISKCLKEYQLGNGEIVDENGELVDDGLFAFLHDHSV